MTVREFLKKYRSGAFAASDVDTMEAAGWIDYGCPVSELQERLRVIYGILSGITSDYVLDSFRIWFTSTVSILGNLYDTIHFSHLDAEKRDALDFSVSIGENLSENNKFKVYTCNDREKAFETGLVEDLTGFIDDWKLAVAADRANRAVKKLDNTGIMVGTKITFNGKTKTCIAINMVNGTPHYVFDDDGYTIGQIRSAVHSSTYRGEDFDIQAPEEDCTEAVEMCPYCEAENVYRNWDVEKQGYVATCKTCGWQMFLCDECRHADDNPGMKCDWRREEHDGKETGICFRGVVENDPAEAQRKLGQADEPALHEPTSFMAYEAEGTRIVFDDFEREGDSCWAELCPACLGKYRKILAGHASDGAAGTCSVKGCQNEADYYLDFKKEEVSFFE